MVVQKPIVRAGFETETPWEQGRDTSQYATEES